MERDTIHLGDQMLPVEELLNRLKAAQEPILKRRRGKRLKPSDQIIREAREERATRL